MSKRCAALACLLLYSLEAFAGDVKVFPAKGMDVSRYETYQWMPIRVLTKQGVIEDDDVVAPFIKQAVNRELQRKGYKEVREGGQLQLLCAGLSVSSNQLEGFLVGWGWESGWGWGPTTSTAISYVNKEGTVAVALLDAQTKKPAWSGYASEALHMETIQKTADKAASKLFKKLPTRKP